MSAPPFPAGDSLVPPGDSLVPPGDSLADRSVADRSVSELARLLEHPAIWRGRSAARRAEALATGYAALDACLPGGGWPRTGLIEILVARFGVGELYLLLPLLAALTSRPAARWCVWIAPPLDPYAAALAAHGVNLERALEVRVPADRSVASRSVVPEPRPGSQRPSGQQPSGQRGNPQRGRGNPQRGRGNPQPGLWAFEQTLGSGASDVALAWAVRDPRTREIRRLQLAAERGKALGVLFRPQRAARQSSPAILRIAVESSPGGARLTLLKSRGGARGSVEIEWTTGS